MAITREQLSLNDSYVGDKQYSVEQCTFKINYIGKTGLFTTNSNGFEYYYAIERFIENYSLAPKPKKKIKLIGYIDDNGFFCEVTDFMDTVPGNWIRVSEREIEILDD